MLARTGICRRATEAWKAERLARLRQLSFHHFPDRIPSARVLDTNAGVALSRFPATHTDNSAPALLGVLRVCDVPQALGLLAPRPATLVGPAPDCEDAAALYCAAGVPEKFMVKK